MLCKREMNMDPRPLCHTLISLSSSLCTMTGTLTDATLPVQPISTLHLWGLNTLFVFLEDDDAVDALAVLKKVSCPGCAVVVSTLKSMCQV